MVTTLLMFLVSAVFLLGVLIGTLATECAVRGRHRRQAALQKELNMKWQQIRMAQRSRAKYAQGDSSGRARSADKLRMATQ